MIVPDPASERLHYVEDDALAYMEFPVPAAGHLGVIEEGYADALHEKATEDGHPCPGCSAVL